MFQKRSFNKVCKRVLKASGHEATIDSEEIFPCCEIEEEE